MSVSWQQRLGEAVIRPRRPFVWWLTIQVVVGLLAAWGAFVLVAIGIGYVSALLTIFRL